MTGEKIVTRSFFISLYLLTCCLAACQPPEIVDVNPKSMNQYGHEWIEIQVKDLPETVTASQIDVQVGGVAAFNFNSA